MVSLSVILILSVYLTQNNFKSGFSLNNDKSVRPPTNICVWLDTVIDTNEGNLRILEQRNSPAISSIKMIYRKLSLVTPNDLSSVAGKIVSISLVLGSITKLMTKYLF